MYNIENTEYLIEEEHVALTHKDRNKCAFVADITILQCIIVCGGSISILTCLWTPEFSTLDYDKLVRIMYLYDHDACGYNLRKAKQIANLHISNETLGLNILPIKWLPALSTVSTRLSTKTRKYIELSCVFHVIWFMAAIIFRMIIRHSSDPRTLKVALTIFIYTFFFITGFDFSMAVLYITHIKQSLTKGMILRYSGWGNEMELKTYDDFAGWLPMAASACWLRGVVIFIVNLYLCRLLTITKRKVKRREIKKGLLNERYCPFPEAQQFQSDDTTKVLVFQVGEKKPQLKGFGTFF